MTGAGYFCSGFLGISRLRPEVLSVYVVCHSCWFTLNLLQDWYRLLSDPNRTQLARMLQVGERVSWPALRMVRNRLTIEVNNAYTPYLTTLRALSEQF